MYRNFQIVFVSCLLGFMTPSVVFAAKPASKVLPPGGNTIAGPGSFNLTPGTGELVYRSAFVQPTNAKICVTVVVTSVDVVTRLNVIGYPSIFITSAASQSFCNDIDAIIEVRCDPGNLASCTGFWRVDLMP